MKPTEFLGKITPTGKCPSRKKNKPTCFAFAKGDCPKGSACDCWHPSECSLSSKRELQTFEEVCFSSSAERLGVSQRNEIILGWVAKTPKQRIKSLRKVYLLHGVPAVPAKSILQNMENNIVKKFRLARVSERRVQERGKKGPTLGIMQHVGQSGLSPNALSYEQLEIMQIFLKQTWNFARKKWACAKKDVESKPCGKCFGPPNKATQEKVVAPRSSCEHEAREFIVNSGTSLDMRKNELRKRNCQKIKRTKKLLRPPTARQSRRKKPQCM